MDIKNNIKVYHVKHKLGKVYKNVNGQLFYVTQDLAGNFYMINLETNTVGLTKYKSLSELDKDYLYSADYEVKAEIVLS